MLAARRRASRGAKLRVGAAVLRVIAPWRARRPNRPQKPSRKIARAWGMRVVFSLPVRTFFRPVSARVSERISQRFSFATGRQTGTGTEWAGGPHRSGDAHHEVTRQGKDDVELLPPVTKAQAGLADEEATERSAR